MKNILKLIRIQNALIVALTMCTMRYAIIIPICKYYHISSCLTTSGFVCLVLAAMLILAAGNVINDYFDRRTDMINRPKKVVIGFSIHRRKAIIIHWGLSLIGIICGFIASCTINKPLWGLMFCLIAFLLWGYSAYLKRHIFIDNLLVAMLTACIPLAVAVFEYVAFQNSTSSWNNNAMHAVKFYMQVIIAFAIFAFIFNLIREIIKDCQDLKGDSQTGIRSIPIAIGKKSTNYLVCIIAAIATAIILIFWHLYLVKLSFFTHNPFAWFYIYVLMALPTAILAIAAPFGTSQKKYSSLSKIIKTEMIIGLLFSFVICYAIYVRI